MFNYGDEVRDIITGVKGIVVGRTEYFTGCTHIGIAPATLKDGKAQDWQWPEESRLELVKAKKVAIGAGPKRSGAFPNPPSI